jgi:hypothetical protein
VAGDALLQLEQAVVAAADDEDAGAGRDQGDDGRGEVGEDRVVLGPGRRGERSRDAPAAGSGPP